MTAKWLAFVMWAAVAASAVFWGFRLSVPALPLPAHASTVSTDAALRGDLARLFGTDARPVVAAAEVAAPADARFQLVGVVSPRTQQAAGEGLALIAVDGKPAKAYRVGAAVEGETVLQTVTSRGAALGPKGQAATVALEIAPLAPAATGTMPGVLPVAAPLPAPTSRPSTATRPAAAGMAVPGALSSARNRPQPEPSEPPPPPPQ